MEPIGRVITVQLEAPEGLKGNKQVISIEIEDGVAYRHNSTGGRKTMGRRGIAEIGRAKSG
jgi:hypothetical protein